MKASIDREEILGFSNFTIASAAVAKDRRAAMSAQSQGQQSQGQQQQGTQGSWEQAL